MRGCELSGLGIYNYYYDYLLLLEYTITYYSTSKQHTVVVWCYKYVSWWGGMGRDGEGGWAWMDAWGSLGEPGGGMDGRLGVSE